MRFFILALLFTASAACAADFRAAGPREIRGNVMNDPLTEKLSIIINYGSFSMGDDAMQSMPVTGATPAVQTELEELSQGEMKDVIVKGVVHNAHMTVNEIVDPSAVPPRATGWQALAEAHSLLIEALAEGIKTAGRARAEACIAAATSLEKSNEPDAVRRAAAALRQRAQGLLLH